ncbi:MAG TPA: acyl-CoA dehydrogenase family protein [Acidimicrobiia bacterium]|nr:acyl-CoA dehydrogenase family protein [Acidimicrobiia bacterium]
MDLTDSKQESEFRDQVRTWLKDNLTPEFLAVGGKGGAIDDQHWEIRLEWEKLLGENKWLGMSWPKEFGGRESTFMEQVIFNQEYVRANAPARASFFGEGLFAPTVLAFGTDEQKQTLLPRIQNCEDVWCQGYSEPNAGSDLAAISTHAHLEDDEWVINGQKTWTTLAHKSNWIFAVVRTDKEAGKIKKQAGLTYMLIPLDQEGVSVRPLVQMTGTKEFNEVFFENARTHKDNVIGEVNDGWKVAMATLGFERGTAFLAQQLSFAKEVKSVIEVAKDRGVDDDEAIVSKLVDSYVGVEVMKYNGMRMLTDLVEKGVLGPASSIGKLYWSNWHRTFGERVMDVLGTEGLQATYDDPDDYSVNDLQRIFMFSRSETIYAGTSEIQKNIVAEQVLGLPKEPKMQEGSKS